MTRYIEVTLKRNTEQNNFYSSSQLSWYTYDISMDVCDALDTFSLVCEEEEDKENRAPAPTT